MGCGASSSSPAPQGDAAGARTAPAPVAVAVPPVAPSGASVDNEKPREEGAAVNGSMQVHSPAPPAEAKPAVTLVDAAASESEGSSVVKKERTARTRRQVSGAPHGMPASLADGDALPAPSHDKSCPWGPTLETACGRARPVTLPNQASEAAHDPVLMRAAQEAGGEAEVGEIGGDIEAMAAEAAAMAAGSGTI